MESGQRGMEPAPAIARAPHARVIPLPGDENKPNNPLGVAAAERKSAV